MARRTYTYARVCDVCGHHFTAHRPHASFCSPACRQRASRLVRFGPSGREQTQRELDSLRADIDQLQDMQQRRLKAAKKNLRRAQALVRSLHAKYDTALHETTWAALRTALRELAEPEQI